jgi:hypothetical protein
MNLGSFRSLHGPPGTSGSVCGLHGPPGTFGSPGRRLACLELGNLYLCLGELALYGDPLSGLLIGLLL